MSTKANIIPSGKDFIKLKRRLRPGFNDVYEIDVYNLCKLVDALSKGKITEHLDMFVMSGRFGVGASNSIEKISKYLLEKLDNSMKEQLFGNVKLDTLLDFKRFFCMCQGYGKNNVANEIRKYIIDNFDISESEANRKITSHYVNV